MEAITIMWNIRIDYGFVHRSMQEISRRGGECVEMLNFPPTVRAQQSEYLGSPRC